MCSPVVKSAVITYPLPPAFLLACVTYTGVFIESFNFSLLASIGIIWINGISVRSSFGPWGLMDLLFKSHATPSR